MNAKGDYDSTEKSIVSRSMCHRGPNKYVVFDIKERNSKEAIINDTYYYHLSKFIVEKHSSRPD